MLIYLLAFVGGALTILSLCILPVVPFVIARAGQQFCRAKEPRAGSFSLFLCLALGACTKSFFVVKHSFSFEVWIRRALGVAMVIGLASIEICGDYSLLTEPFFLNLSGAERHSLNSFLPEVPTVLAAGTESSPSLTLRDPCPI